MTRERVPTVDIIESIVGMLTFDFVITSVTDNLDGTYTLTTCDTYHLQPNFTITIDSVDYTIVSVTRNTNIVISGDTLPTADSFEIYTPHFFHGTPVKSSNEISQISIPQDRVPLAYFAEEFQENYYGKGHALDREVPVRIFFLTESNDRDWNTGAFHANAVNPMRELALQFVEKCISSTYFGNMKDTEFNISTRQRVAVTSEGKGKKDFANQSLSGVELNITLPIKKGVVLCPCTVIVTPTEFTWEQMQTMTWEDFKLMTWEAVRGV